MDKPAFISLTFDDGLRCQFEQAVPILEQYGFSATFFLVANTDPTHTDGGQHPDWRKTDWSVKDVQFFKSMIQQGHEIGAHSVHHRHAFLDNDPKGEAENSKEWIEKRLDIEIPSYCYPFYYLTPPIKNAVISAGYKQARWGANEEEAYYPLQSPIDFFKVDSRLISKYGVEYVGGHPVGRYGAENVNGWIRPDQWHVLVFHGIGTVNDGWWPISIPEFARQMAVLAMHRDAGAVEVVTFRDGAERLRQPK
jgi:peptidoglycan/xylan/chitin deacetylase (PgdA/CDA1 family)